MGGLIYFWPVLLGLALVIGATVVDLYQTLWQTSQNAHGPIVFLICIWFFYFKVSVLIEEGKFKPSPLPNWGYPLLILGCAIYIISRSQGLFPSQVFSWIFILSGITLIFLGKDIYKRLWFGFFFLLFLVPLPGSIIDAMTLPMKTAVSWATDNILYELGYPIARNGVILTIGQYQLMVADACAGMNSLFTLEALGLLYMNVMRHDSIPRNIFLAIMIAPISFASNVTRVILLSLITYYFGDSAGQGFMHEFSGMVLFVTALVLIIGVDSLVEVFLRKRRRQEH